MKFKKNKLKIDDSVETQMYDLMVELFPICRSITCDGLKKTLDIISKYVAIRIYIIQTGKKIFDWKVPEEWNIFNKINYDYFGREYSG